MKRSKWNALWLGTLLGLLTPIVVLLAYYKINYYYLRIDGFLFKMLLNEVITPLLSLCVIGNLGVFFIFINKDYLLSARGVILSTILYAIAVFIVKLS